MTFKKYMYRMVIDIPVLELVHQYSAPYLSANWSAFFSISLDDQSDYNSISECTHISKTDYL